MAETLPPLSRQDRDTYGRMGTTMEMFHNSFRQTWKLLYSACLSGQRPPGMSIRQFLNAGAEFCHHLEMHHSIEEQHIFPVLAQKMPAFKKELQLLTQHKEIHKGLDKLEAYMDECKAGTKDLRMDELKEIMDSFGEVLWAHLSDEVEQLSAENMRKYWSLEEKRKLRIKPALKKQQLGFNLVDCSGTQPPLPFCENQSINTLVNIASKPMSTPSTIKLAEAQLELWRFSSYGDTIQGIESSIASFQSQIANFPRDGMVTAEVADLYTQYYENAESIIVLMLKCHEIPIDPTYRVNIRVQGPNFREIQVGKAQVPGKHAFHEAVLQSLVAPENPLYGMLGHGSVHGFLRDAKDFRNKWTQRRRENDTSNKLLYSMPAMNLLRLQMRELNSALDSALTCTKREVERRSLERPMEAARSRELQERELRSRKEAENQRQIETMKAEQETLIREIENQHHIEAKKAEQEKLIRELENQHQIETQNVELAKLITELEKKVKALEERESRSLQEPQRQTETRNVEQAKLISELRTKIKALEDEKLAREVKSLSSPDLEYEKVIIDIVKVQESQATRIESTRIESTRIESTRIESTRIESLHDENAELAWKVRALQEDNCVRIGKISSMGFMAWYDQLYKRWSSSIMDALEDRNLPGARATLEEAFELSKGSVGPHSTHLGIALKLLENVLALGEAKKKTAVEKLQMALDELKD